MILNLLLFEIIFLIIGKLTSSTLSLYHDNIVYLPGDPLEFNGHRKEVTYHQKSFKTKY